MNSISNYASRFISRATIAVLALVGVIVSAGCQDHHFVPYSESKEPEISKTSADTESIPTRPGYYASQGAAEPAGGASQVPPVVAQNMPYAKQDAPAAAVGGQPQAPAPTGKLLVSGKITMDPKLTPLTGPKVVLFVMLRDPARASGGKMPPVAVRVFSNVTFPLDFDLTDMNIMLAGTVVPENLFLEARLDGDGDAISKNPGDLYGAYSKNPVKSGSTGINLVLDSTL